MKRRTVLKGLLAAPVVAALPAPRYEFNRIPLARFLHESTPSGRPLSLDEFAERYIKPAMRVVVDSQNRAFWEGDQWTPEELEALGA